MGIITRNLKTLNYLENNIYRYVSDDHFIKVIQYIKTNEISYWTKSTQFWTNQQTNYVIHVNQGNFHKKKMKKEKFGVVWKLCNKKELG